MRTQADINVEGDPEEIYFICAGRRSRKDKGNTGQAGDSHDAGEASASLPQDDGLLELAEAGIPLAQLEVRCSDTQISFSLPISTAVKIC